MREHVSAGGTLLGLYSGYHMLGWDITVGSVTKQGIGLLPITSVSQPAECLQKDMMKGQLYPSGTSIEGFEVDCGLREIVEEEKRNVAEWKQKGLAPLLAYNRGRCLDLCSCLQGLSQLPECSLTSFTNSLLLYM